MRQLSYEDKAAAIWVTMNSSQRSGVKMALFPAEIMEAAEKEGYDGHTLVVALMAHSNSKPISGDGTAGTNDRTRA
jgi:hypothetical protein